MCAHTKVVGVLLTASFFTVTGTRKYHPTTLSTIKTCSCARNITSKEYFGGLMHGLLPVGHAFFEGREWVLQHDNNPTHMKASERAVKDWNAHLKNGHIHGGKVQIMKD
jgi:hypothetical protein